MSAEELLERRQTVALQPDEAFALFADAHNLEVITPPWLRFRILTPAPIEMRAGTLISYRLSLHGVPVRWHTRIETWEPPKRFVDVQISGPYALWHHTHEVALRLFVRRDLNRIFDHRRAAIERLVSSGAPRDPAA